MAARPWRTTAQQHPVVVKRADGTVEQVCAESFRKTPYWRSAAWRARRQAVLARDEGRCTMCKRRRGDDDPRLKGGRRVILEVHHLTYQRFGYERLEDLVTLCQRCHATEHQWLRRKARSHR